MYASLGATVNSVPVMNQTQDIPAHQRNIGQQSTSNRVTMVHNTASNALTYQSLTNELEHETSLEDMHMFFVAFYRRQKKIIERSEIARNDASELKFDLVGGQDDVAKLSSGLFND